MNLKKKLVTLGLAVMMLVAMSTTAIASEVKTYGTDEKIITISNVLSSAERAPMNPKGFSEVTSYDVTVSTGAKLTGDYGVSTVFVQNGEQQIDFGNSDPMVQMMIDIYLEDAGIIGNKEHENIDLKAGYTLEFTKTGEYQVFIMDNEMDDRLGFNIIVTDGSSAEEVAEEIVEEIIEEIEEPVVEEPVEEEIQVAETVTALPTASKVLVNGEEVAFDAYNIDGNNYFKLRDVATVVNGTEKQFGVEWDNEKSAINLTSNSEYVAVGGELEKGDGKAKVAVSNSSIIYKDGEIIELETSYTINSNNYFKLRDIAKTFDIGVTWDGETNTVGIDTTIGYETEEAKAE